MHCREPGAAAFLATGLKMKTYAVLLSLVLAASVATTAEAAKHKRHHHHGAVRARTASTTDWPTTPYMDLKPSQVAAFWRDAFDPWHAKW
jgi:hypothetical protein